MSGVGRSGPEYVCTLGIKSWDLNGLLAALASSGLDSRLLNSVMVSPLFSTAPVLRSIRGLKESGVVGTVYFDSGGYQVQRGVIDYRTLCDRLQFVYRQNRWADWYVLPDVPPSNGDGPKSLYAKIKTMVESSLRFHSSLSSDLQTRCVPVVQGLLPDQIRYCLDAYIATGFQRVGFGSFATSGPNSEMNLLTPSSLSLLAHLVRWAGPSTRVHTFGIGTPPATCLISRVGVSSMDSSAWIKSAAFGNVFLPFGRAYNVSHRTLRYGAVSRGSFEAMKEAAGHDCPFCSDFRALSNSRRSRMLHNLVCAVETLSPDRQASADALLARFSPRYSHLWSAYQRSEGVS